MSLHQHRDLISREKICFDCYCFFKITLESVKSERFTNHDILLKIILWNRNQKYNKTPEHLPSNVFMTQRVEFCVFVGICAVTNWSRSFSFRSESEEKSSVTETEAIFLQTIS